MHLLTSFASSDSPEQVSSWMGTVRATVLALIGFAVFGAVMSFGNGDLRLAGSLSWKLPVLFFGSVALCVPSLFVFSRLRGSVLSLQQLLRVVIQVLATASVVLLSLAPISGFFSWTTDEQYLIGDILQPFILIVAAGFGIAALAQAMSALAQQLRETVPGSSPAIEVLIPWCCVLLLVGVQMRGELGPWYDWRGTLRGESVGAFIQPPQLRRAGDGSQRVIAWEMPTGACPITEALVLYQTHELRHRDLSQEGKLTVTCADEVGMLRCSAVVNSVLRQGESYDFRAQVSYTCPEETTRLSDTATLIIR